MDVPRTWDITDDLGLSGAVGVRRDSKSADEIRRGLVAVLPSIRLDH